MPEYPDAVRLMRYALKRRAKDEGDWYLNRLQRWYYTAKAILCAIFGLERGEWEYDDGEIVVAAYDFTHGTIAQEFYGAFWTEFVVKKKGWGYHERSEQSG